jgi:hypothetical protein
LVGRGRGVERLSFFISGGYNATGRGGGGERYGIPNKNIPNARAILTAVNLESLRRFFNSSLGQWRATDNLRSNPSEKTPEYLRR